MRGHREHPRSAPSARANASSLLDARAVRVASRRQQPGAALVNRSGRACSRPPVAAPPSGCPPTNVKRGGSAARRVHNRPLRAAGVGDDGGRADVLVKLLEQPMFCRTGAARMTRSASASTIRSSAATSMACRRIAVSSTSLLSTAMTSEDGQMLPGGERDRPTDQAQADDADLSKIGGCLQGGRLDDGSSIGKLKSNLNHCELRPHSDMSTS